MYISLKIFGTNILIPHTCTSIFTSVKKKESERKITEKKELISFVFYCEILYELVYASKNIYGQRQ